MKINDVQLYSISMTSATGEQEEVTSNVTWDTIKREVAAWEDVAEVGGIEAAKGTMIQIYAAGLAWECECGDVNREGDDTCNNCDRPEVASCAICGMPDGMEHLPEAHEAFDGRAFGFIF